MDTQLTMTNVLVIGVVTVLTTLVPLLAVIILAVKKRINVIPLLVGCAAFFVSQMVIRLPIISFLSTMQWYHDFANNNFLLYVLVLSLTAGLFEESARFGGATLLKKNRTYKDMISFGLGHGLIEVVLLIGMSYLSNFALTFMITTGVEIPPTLIPPQAMEQVSLQLAGITPGLASAAVLERISAVTFHMFATMLVFKGVILKKPLFLLLAILAHTVFNLASALVANYIGMWASEITLLILAAVCGFFLYRSKDSFNGSNQPANPVIY